MELQIVHRIDDRLSAQERKTLTELESTRPATHRSTVDLSLSHADRFRQAMLSGESGRAWGIYMGTLRPHYPTLGEAIERLCEGMDVTAAKQDLQKKSTLFRMVGSAFQDVLDEEEF